MGPEVRSAQTRRRHSVAVILVGLGAFLLAGCGSSGSEDGAARSTTTRTAEVTSTSARSSSTTEASTTTEPPTTTSEAPENGGSTRVSAQRICDQFEESLAAVPELAGVTVGETEVEHNPRGSEARTEASAIDTCTAKLSYQGKEFDSVIVVADLTVDPTGLGCALMEDWRDDRVVQIREQFGQGPMDCPSTSSAQPGFAVGNQELQTTGWTPDVFTTQVREDWALQLILTGGGG